MFLFIEICFSVSLSFLISSVWELKLGKLPMGNHRQLSVKSVALKILKAKSQAHLMTGAKHLPAGHLLASRCSIAVPCLGPIWFHFPW